jgi:prepilin signal peptidase PulO-like enzyme (type II secretory pathway)
MSPYRAACSTTGIPTVNSAWQAAYYLFILLAVAGFAIYDIKTRRVPNKALVLFCTVAPASPVLNALITYSGVFDRSNLIVPLLVSVMGAAAGFIVLLAAAIASKGGNGVGGGDIKLAAVLGFIYGPAGIISILLVASLLALPAGLIQMKRSGGQTLRMAFVPFTAAGCLAVTAVQFLI